MAGIAEWKLAGSAWLQVSVAESSVGQSSIAIGIKDINAQAQTLDKLQISHTPIVDHGFVKIMESKDPAGNTVLFVQETGTSPQ